MLWNPINTGLRRMSAVGVTKNGRFDGHSENDADAVSAWAGRSRRSHEQAIARDAGASLQSRGQRSQKERGIRTPGYRQAGAGGSEGPSGPESRHGRIDQDPGQEGGQVPRRESGEGCDRSAE